MATAHAIRGKPGPVQLLFGKSYMKYSLTSITLFYCRTEVLRWQVPQIEPHNTGLSGDLRL